MATELTDLDLFEVSLVDDGDDPLAKVSLFKRKEGSDMEKTKEQWQEEVDTLTQEITTLKAKVDEAEADAIEKAKTQEDTIEIDGEMIAKSAIPASVLKRMETLETEAKELLKAKEQEDLRKMAREKLPSMKGTEDQKGKLLKAVGDDADLLEILIAADKLFGELFKEKGKTDSENDMKTADAKLDDMVKAHMVEKNTTFYSAYADVIKTAAGKALLQETRKKKD